MSCICLKSINFETVAIYKKRLMSLTKSFPEFHNVDNFTQKEKIQTGNENKNLKLPVIFWYALANSILSTRDNSVLVAGPLIKSALSR